MSYLTRLDADLAGCREEGIISAEQAAKISQWVSARLAAARVRGAVWIAVAAGLFVAAGVTLIVAHNWDRIPVLAKLGSFLAVLALTGELSLRGERRPAALAVPLELLWFVLPASGIGLYAQIFQLSGDPVKPYVVWLLLSLPLAWFSPRKIVAALHVAALLLVLLWGSFASESAFSFLTIGDRAPHPLAWLWAASAIGLVLAQSGLRLPVGHRTHAVGGVLIWALALMEQDTPFRIEHAGWLLLAGVSACVVWLALSRRWGAGAVEKRLPVLAWAIGVYVMTFFWHDKVSSSAGALPFGLALAALLSASALLLLAGVPRGALSPHREWERFALAALALSLLAAGLIVLDSPFCTKTAAALANVLLLASGAGLMRHGALASSSAQINFGAGLAALVLITRFLDLFGSMLQSGAAFIAAGLLLAAFAYALQRGRQALIARGAAGEAA